MFSLTESAAKQVSEAAKQTDCEGMALRIAAKYREDGSIEYGMGFDQKQDADLTSNQHGVELLVDPASAELLDECIMDFVELESGNWEFIFLNPADPHYIPPKSKKKPKN